MKKHGQSIIEYIFIAVLVILGVVTMGPYVLRSINGHFKLWDTGVQDSFRENLSQAPANAVPPIITNCYCWDTPTNSCGSPGGGIGCAPYERIIQHNCPANAQQCDGEPVSSCQTDCNFCCSIYYSGSCGGIPIPAGGLPVPTGPTCSSLGIGATTCSTPPSANNCYYGQRMWSTQCNGVQCPVNTTIPSLECVTDTNCNPQCLGIIRFGPSSVVACPNSPNSLATGLNQSATIAIVATPTNTGNGETYCTPNPPYIPCEFYCAPGYFFDPRQGDCSNQFEVPPALDTTHYLAFGSYVPGEAVTQVNNWSFNMCNDDPNELITGTTVSRTGASAPETGTYSIPASQLSTRATPDETSQVECGSPGEPTQNCDVSTSD